MDFTTPLPEEKLPKGALAMILDFQIGWASVIFEAPDDWFIIKSEAPGIATGEHKYKGLDAVYKGWSMTVQAYADICAEASRRGFVEILRWAPTNTKTPGLMALINDAEAVSAGSARMRYEQLGPEFGEGEFFIEYDAWPFVQDRNTQWEQIVCGAGFKNLSKIYSAASEWAAAAQQYATLVEGMVP